jgi:DNA polymerase III subunit gamma/tau
MDSNSLAVKYRPTNLAEVHGQEAVVAIVEGLLKTKKIPTSILLSGHTGCGKTTIAKIIGYTLNCAKGTRCGKCDSCKMGEANPDVIDYNAGKDGGIDAIRKLILSSKVAPMFNKRVIVVDEAHKLTGASLEAMLLPAEQGSKKTLWIFCTTNKEKLTDTLNGRCLKLAIKAIAHEPMVERLKEIAKAEEIKPLIGKKGKEVLELIAHVSNGSMREAISQLEAVQLALASGRKFDSAAELQAVVTNGDVDLGKSAAQLVGAILETDLTSAINVIRTTNNARGLLSKSKWLTDWLIAVKTKTARYTPHDGRVFKELYPKTKTPLSFLMAILSMLVEAEMRMNSTSIDENILIMTHTSDLISEAKG